MVSAFILATVLSSASPATFTTVFGATVGKTAPSYLVRLFGAGDGEVRHYWKESEHTFIRDDGWNWWTWPEGNADIQSYWTPAYPKKKRHIEQIWLSSAQDKPSAHRIHPAPQLQGWLSGIRMEMPQAKCLQYLTVKFGKPEVSMGEYVWHEGPKHTLSVSFGDGRLVEMVIN